MEKLILLLILTLASISAFAKDVKSTTVWKPAGFSELSNIEQKIINNLGPINNRNKSYVQLILDMGKYKDCGIGTALTHDKIYFSLIDKKNLKKYSFVLKLNESLINENEFLNGENYIYVLVFNKVSPAANVSETFFMYFNIAQDGSGVKAMQLTSKKITANKNIVARIFDKETVEPNFNIECTGK